MSDLSTFLMQLSNGLAQGSIYALIALGYTMVYGIVKLINFAHGDILMVGAFASFYALKFQGWVAHSPSSGAAPIMRSLFAHPAFSLPMAAAFAVIVCVVLNVVIERLAYKPLRSAPRINALITAIGVSFILENGARVIPFMGPTPRPFPTIRTQNLFKLGDFTVSNIQALVLITAILSMLALTLVVSYTRIGKAMRAVSFDLKAASLMGIPVDFVISVTFGLGAALAAVGGLLFSLSYPQVEPYMGIMPGLKAFIAAVFGGIGSLPGAVLGGYVLGVAEIMAKGYISSKLSDAVVFGILILILIIKPSGLLGKGTREKV